jgi:hypothetical protein
VRAPYTFSYKGVVHLMPTREALEADLAKINDQFLITQANLYRLDGARQMIQQLLDKEQSDEPIALSDEKD